MTQMHSWVGRGTIVRHGHRIFYPFHDAATTAGGWLLLAVRFAMIAGTFCVRFWVFNREASRTAENL
jgi:hypothetical protein